MKPTFLLAAGIVLASHTAASADSPKGPALTGREVLLEAVDKNGQLGIYALDVLAPQKPAPRLLVKGASSPRWSLHHQKFLFTRNQTLSIYERNGDQKAWWARAEMPNFANPALFEQGRMEWDYTGKAQYIENRPGFGSVFSRSMSLSEKQPLTRENPPLNGFRDSIIPLLNGVPQSIGNASVSPDEKLLAAQVYPALPQNQGSDKSRIRLYDMFYQLGKTNQAQWRQKVNENYQHFLPTGVAPQVGGPGREIGSPTPDCIDIEPRFSPSGKYIAFNRINTREKSVRPMLVEVAHPETAYPLENPVWAKQHNAAHDPVWGNPHHRAVAWSTDKDQLWIVSADSAVVSKLTLPEGTWQCLNLAGQTNFPRPPAQYAFHDDYVIGIWSGWPQQIQLFKVDSNAETQSTPTPALSLPLPQGFNVRRLEW